MLSVWELESKFTFEQTSFMLNAIKYAGANNATVICDGNWVNQGFFKMFKP